MTVGFKVLKSLWPLSISRTILHAQVSLDLFNDLLYRLRFVKRKDPSLAGVLMPYRRNETFFRAPLEGGVLANMNESSLKSPYLWEVSLLGRKRPLIQHLRIL